MLQNNSPVLLQKLINNFAVCKHCSGTLVLVEDVSHVLRYKHNNLQKLMFTQTQQQRQWNAFFQFCFFVFDADFATKHVQFLISKIFPNFWSKDIEADSLTLFLHLCCWLWTDYCLSSYRILYVISLVFSSSIIF